MDDLKTTYNKIAADWSQDHQDDTWWREGTDAFISLLSEKARVLDAGCGSGVKSAYLVNKGFEVVGIDFSENLIDIARRKAPSAQFQVMDIKNVQDVVGQFDGVFVQAVLLHIPKKEVAQVLRGLKEKLKPGGYLYVAVKEQRPGQPEEETVTENDYGYEYSRFFSYFTLGEIKEQLRTAGMDIKYEDVATSGKTNWIQVVGQRRT